MPLTSTCYSEPADAARWLESNTGTISDAIRTIVAVKESVTTHASDRAAEATKDICLTSHLSTIQNYLDQKSKDLAPCPGNGDVHAKQLSGLWTVVGSGDGPQEPPAPTPEMYNDVARFLSLQGFVTEIPGENKSEPIDAARVVAEAMTRNGQRSDGLPPSVRKVVFKEPKSGPCVFQGAYLYYPVPLGMEGCHAAWHGSLHLQQITTETIRIRARQHQELNDTSSADPTESPRGSWAVTCQIQWPTVLAANRYGPAVADIFKAGPHPDAHIEYSRTVGTLQTIKVHTDGSYTPAQIRVMVVAAVKKAQEDTNTADSDTPSLPEKFIPPVTTSNASTASAPPRYLLRVPENFPDSGEIYAINATHRGDMYHLRGAMVLEPRPIIIYNSTSDTKDLEAYLANSSSTQRCFVTALKLKDLKENRPQDGYKFIRPYKIINESGATSIIAKATSEENKDKKANQKRLAAGMVMLSDEHKGKLEEDMLGMCNTLFQKKYDVMIVYRDTGTKCPNPGVHPELESGDSSISFIANLVGEINKMDVVLCGNVNKIGDWHSIGEYFKLIPAHGKLPQRDVEAWFLQFAYENGFYKMVVGFRSGALDLFTFMGIPTVSISLRRYVGERRHGKIAENPVLHRWNIQYEMPRHITTAYVPNIGKRFIDIGSDMGSPWWVFDKSRDAPGDEEKKKHCSEPSLFAPSDIEVVGYGIQNAIYQELPSRVGRGPVLTVLPERKPGDAHVFDNTCARPCYFEFFDLRFFELRWTKEMEDFILRKENRTHTKEPREVYEDCRRKMEEDWDKILEELKKHKDPADESESEDCDQDGYVII